MFKRAEKAGQHAALEAFGLTHMSRPPATWTQKWLSEPVKNVTKRVTVPSVSQEALR